MPTLILLAVFVFFIAAVWRVFTKAGQPGWAALIPIYNMVILTQVAGRPEAAGSSEPAEGAAFEPGSPIGVGLVRGDLTFAATGTVTHVDGDRVYAFGHPFFGSGEVELPMHTARVLHVLADMLGSNKISVIGPEAGTIVEDRLTAIVGRMGQKAAMIPLDLSVRGAGYGEDSFHFEIARNSDILAAWAA